MAENWILSQEIISIPAPARGATTVRVMLAKEAQISIPAPARGATQRPSTTVNDGQRFQFPPPREGRQQI